MRGWTAGEMAVGEVAGVVEEAPSDEEDGAGDVLLAVRFAGGTTWGNEEAWPDAGAEFGS